MAEPHFQVGDLVRVQALLDASPADAFVEAVTQSSILGIYEVTAILPQAQGAPQYRLKSIAGLMEQTVRESQINPAARKTRSAHERQRPEEDTAPHPS